MQKINYTDFLFSLRPFEPGYHEMVIIFGYNFIYITLLKNDHRVLLINILGYGYFRWYFDPVFFYCNHLLTTFEVLLWLTLARLVVDECVNKSFSTYVHVLASSFKWINIIDITLRFKIVYYSMEILLTKIQRPLYFHENSSKSNNIFIKNQIHYWWEIISTEKHWHALFV